MHSEKKRSPMIKELPQVLDGLLEQLFTLSCYG